MGGMRGEDVRRETVRRRLRRPTMVEEKGLGGTVLKTPDTAERTWVKNTGGWGETTWTHKRKKKRGKVPQGSPRGRGKGKWPLDQPGWG